MNHEPLFAIKDYLKATGDGTDPAYPLFQTLGKRGLNEEGGLTHKAIDCLIRAVAREALIQKRVTPM